MSPAARRAWGGLGLVVVVTAAMPSLVSTPTGAGMVSDRLSAGIPGSIALEGVRVSWTGPASLDRATLTDPEGRVVASVEGVSAPMLTAWTVLTGRRDPGPIAVESLDAMVVINEHGLSNLERALVDPMAPGTGQGPSPLLALLRVSLEDGRVAVVDETGEYVAERIRLTAGTDSGTTTLDAAADLASPHGVGALSVSGSVAGTGTDAALDIVVTADRLPVPMLAALSGEARLAALPAEHLSARVEVEGTLAAPTGHVVIEGDGVEVDASLSSGPSGLAVAPGSSLEATVTPAALAALTTDESPVSLASPTSLRVEVHRFDVPLDGGAPDLAAATGAATVEIGEAMLPAEGSRPEIGLGPVSLSVETDRLGRQVDAGGTLPITVDGLQAAVEVAVEAFSLVGPPDSSLRGWPPAVRVEATAAGVEEGVVSALSGLPPLAALVGAPADVSLVLRLQGDGRGSMGSFDVAANTPLLDLEVGGAIEFDHYAIDPQRTGAALTLAPSSLAALLEDGSEGPTLGLAGPTRVTVSLDQGRLERTPGAARGSLVATASVGQATLAGPGGEVTARGSATATLDLGAPRDSVMVVADGELGGAAWQAGATFSGAPLALVESSVSLAGVSPAELTLLGMPMAEILGGVADLALSRDLTGAGSMSLEISAPALSAGFSWLGVEGLSLAAPTGVAVVLDQQLLDRLVPAGESRDGDGARLALAEPVEVSVVVSRADLDLETSQWNVEGSLAADAASIGRGEGQPVAMSGLAGTFDASGGEGGRSLSMSVGAMIEEGAVSLDLETTHSGDLVGTAVSAQATSVPSAGLDALLGTGGLISAALGPVGDAVVEFHRPPDGEGELLVDLGGGGTWAMARGVAGEAVRLSGDGTAEMVVTPALAERFLAMVNPFLLTALEAEEPVAARLLGDTFLLPLDPYDLATVEADLEVDIGEVTLTAGGPLKSVFEALGKGLGERTRASFTPARLHLRNGVVTYERMTMTAGFLVAHLEGTVDLVAESVDMRLTIPRDSLRPVLGDLDPFLGENFEAVVPVRGTLDAPEVDKGALKELVNDLLAELALRALGALLIGAL